MGIYTNMMKERANAVKGLASSVTSAAKDLAKGLSKGNDDETNSEEPTVSEHTAKRMGTLTEPGKEAPVTNEDIPNIEEPQQQTQRMDFDDQMAEKAMARTTSQMGYLNKRKVTNMMKNDRDDTGGLM